MNRLVIFDCDGVLVDSEILVIEIEARLLAELGISLTTTEVADRFVGLSDTDMARRIRDDFGITLTEEFDAARDRAMHAAFETSLRAVEGIHDVVAGVTGPKCIASSSSLERIDRSVRLTGLDDLIGPDRFSASQVERGKPAPDLFLMAASSMGTDPSTCIVIEDSPFGIEAAVAAGMTAIGFIAGRHCGPRQAQRLIDAGCHDLARTSQELAGLLD